MIIFLYGPDDYRRELKKRELVATFEKKHSGLGLDRFDAGAPEGRDRFLAFIENQSIFEPAKLAVLENAYEAEDKEFLKKLQAIRSMPKVSVLISEADIPPKALAFLRTESKKDASGNLAQKFEKMSGAEWRAFLRRVAKEKGAELEPKALEFLAQAYEGDAWRAVTELEKMALLDKVPVTREDLEGLAVELAPNFWATMNALKSPRIGERLAMLEKLFARSEPAAKIFNILSAQAWPPARPDDAGRSGGDKLSQFAKYDAAVKSGKCEYEEVLLDLVLS